MSDTEEGFAWGFIVGVILTILIWLAAADIVEEAKVATGHLTCDGKVYKVKLFSELEYPEKPKGDTE